MTAKPGLAPSAAWNDDLAELWDDASLEECLPRALAAGVRGRFVAGMYPRVASPLVMARTGRGEAMRRMAATGYEVVQ